MDITQDMLEKIDPDKLSLITANMEIPSDRGVEYVGEVFNEFMEESGLSFDDSVNLLSQEKVPDEYQKLINEVKQNTDTNNTVLSLTSDKSIGIWAVKKWGLTKAVEFNKLYEKCRDKAGKYAGNHNLPNAWNNEADSYRHFLYSAEMGRKYGYDVSKEVTDMYEFFGLKDKGWLSKELRFTELNSPIVYTKMNQETLMDLWNNQVGRMLAQKSEYRNKTCEELFEIALNRGWLITDANKVYDFLGIESYISNKADYSVDVGWDRATGNITVYGEKPITLKIGV